MGAVPSNSLAQAAVAREVARAAIARVRGMADSYRSERNTRGKIVTLEDPATTLDKAAEELERLLLR